MKTFFLKHRINLLKFHHSLLSKCIKCICVFFFCIFNLINLAIRKIYFSPFEVHIYSHRASKRTCDPSLKYLFSSSWKCGSTKILHSLLLLIHNTFSIFLLDCFSFFSVIFFRRKSLEFLFLSAYIYSFMFQKRRKKTSEIYSHLCNAKYI